MAEKVAIAKVWTFSSDSSPDKEHETIQYVNLTTSCSCMGWTRRVDAKGERSCKHTRLVDQGRADKVCVSSHDYTKSDEKIKQAFEVSVATAKDTLGTGKRRLSF